MAEFQDRMKSSVLEALRVMALGQPPRVDLGRITVNRGQQNQAEAAPMPSVPASIMAPQPNVQPMNNQSSIPEAARPKVDPEARKRTIQNLLRVGVPLAALGISSANEDFLPSAAGFSQGFGEQMSAQDEDRREKAKKKKFIIVDPDTGETVREMEVPADATVQQAKKGSAGLNDLIQAEFETPPASSKTNNSGKVLVKDGEGNTFRLPRNQLEDALNQGFSLVE